jgi:uncharacterized protein (DUF433 family)
MEYSGELPMRLPEFLSQDSHGEITLTGHRIGLYHLVSYYNEGHSPEMLVCCYPTLPLSLVHKVLGFYLENRAEVDAYVAQCQSQLQQQREANPRRLDVDTLRQRLDAKHRAEALKPPAEV